MESKDSNQNTGAETFLFLKEILCLLRRCESPMADTVGAIYNDAILLLKTFKDFLAHGSVRLTSLDPVLKVKDQLNDEQMQRVL